MTQDPWTYMYLAYKALTIASTKNPDILAFSIYKGGVPFYTYLASPDEELASFLHTLHEITYRRKGSILYARKKHPRGWVLHAVITKLGVEVRIVVRG